MTVQVDLKHPFITENSIHHFTCFASDVEVFRKGFPRKVSTNLGNGMDFVGWKKNIDENGDLRYVVYKQAFGCVTLQVFND